MENVIIGKGNLMGKGVYAAKNFSKDEIVIKYRLQPLNDQEYSVLSEFEKDFVHSHRN